MCQSESLLTIRCSYLGLSPGACQDSNHDCQRHVRDLREFLLRKWVKRWRKYYAPTLVAPVLVSCDSSCSGNLEKWSDNVMRLCRSVEHFCRLWLRHETMQITWNLWNVCNHSYMSVVQASISHWTEARNETRACDSSEHDCKQQNIWISLIRG